MASKSGNIVFKDLNPLTKKYLSEIEKAYTKRADSLGGTAGGSGN